MDLVEIDILNEDVLYRNNNNAYHILVSDVFKLVVYNNR